MKYAPEERLSISGLKFLADKFHVKLRQKNTNVTQMPPNAPIINHSVRIKVGFHGDVQSLKKIDSENNLFHTGFVSYQDFSKVI